MKSKRVNQAPFITFEGGEGSGKTTVIEHLFKVLKEAGIPVIQTREPGGTSLGMVLRKLLLGEEHIEPKSELLLFLADRAQHVEECILPALKKGQTVLCDRFTDSTLAYQGAARTFDLQEIEPLCMFAASNLVPDLTFFLDIDPTLGLQRAHVANQGNDDRLEQETLAFHLKVQQGYQKLAEKEPNRIHMVDASLSKEKVFHMIYEQVLKCYN